MLYALALAALVAVPAHAGKKKKDKKSAPIVERPVPAPAAEAPDAGVSIGRPAGMDFLELPCPYTAGSEHTWTLETSGRNAKTTGTQVMSIVEVTPGTISFDVGGDRQVETDDPVMKRLTESSAAFEPKPHVQYFIESLTLNLANGPDLLPLYTELGKEIGVLMKEQGAPDNAIRNMQQMLSNPAMLEGSVVQHLYPFFNFTCGSFPTAPTEYETEVMSPMGVPLPAKGTMVLERPGPDRVRFVNAEAVPLDALVPAVLKLTGGTVTPEAEAKLREELQTMDGQVSTRLTVDVHVPTGAITHLLSEQVIKLPGAEQHNVRELHAVPAP